MAGPSITDDYVEAQQTSAAPGSSTASGGVVSGSQQEVEAEDVAVVLNSFSGLVTAITGGVATIMTAEGESVQVPAQDITNVYHRPEAPRNGNGNGEAWGEVALGGGVLAGLALLLFWIVRR